MPRALVGVVREVDVCDLGKGRAGVFGKWVQGKAVEDDGEDLGLSACSSNKGAEIVRKPPERRR